MKDLVTVIINILDYQFDCSHTDWSKLNNLHNLILKNTEIVGLYYLRYCGDNVYLNTWTGDIIPYEDFLEKEMISKEHVLKILLEWL